MDGGPSAATPLGGPPGRLFGAGGVRPRPGGPLNASVPTTISHAPGFMDDARSHRKQLLPWNEKSTVGCYRFWRHARRAPDNNGRGGSIFGRVIAARPTPTSFGMGIDVAAC